MATNIFLLLLLGAAVQPPPPEPQSANCVDELVVFSPCLPFVSDPPNNASDSVAPQCCDVLSSAFESSDGYCFCYVLRQPLIFGFPLNKERVPSLPSFCMAKNGVASLDSLCSGVPSLPPLPSTTDSSDSSDLPPEPVVNPPTPPSSSVEQAMFTSTSNRVWKQRSWFLLGMMSFLLSLHSILV